MSFSSEDLFVNINDINGFSDDENIATNNIRDNKIKSNEVGNCFLNNKIRKDNWKSRNSNVQSEDSKNENVVKEVYSGIRITKPLVSSDELHVMMKGRKMIKLSMIKSNINKLTNDIDFDWVTIGVIVNKMTKVSKNGKDYSIWNLSDLMSTKVTSFFLFGMVHEKHWKLPVGSVIGLLNSSFMNKNNMKSDQKNNEIGPLTIDDPDKLLHIGTSKDMGYCKAIKKNGDICGSMILRAEDEFCLYHIKNAYRKFSSKRAEIQSNFANKEPEQYHFANNFMPNVSLNKNNIVLEMNKLNKSQRTDKKEIEAKNLKKILENPLSRSAKTLAATKTNFLKEKSTKVEITSPLHAQDIFGQLKNINNKSKMDYSPSLAKGYKKGQMIDLEITTRNNHQMDLNKIRAIEILKNKQNISSSPSNNMLSNKRKKLEQILKKVDSNLSESNDELKKQLLEAEKKEAKLLEEALKRKSINENAVNLIENEAQKQHFELLEKRENYQNRLENIKELFVKVVTCQTCKYTATLQSEYCKSKNHEIHFRQARKRFFICKNCRYRKFTFDSVFPETECKNCGASSFEKTSIINVKTETKLGDDLLIRGEEIKFLNSVR